MNDTFKGILGGLDKEVLVTTIVALSTKIESLEQTVDTLVADNNSWKRVNAENQEKISDAWAEHKQMQDKFSTSQRRVAQLFGHLERMAKIINQDNNEVSDGEVIDELVEVLDNEFEQVNGLFFVDKDGEVI